MEALLCLIVGLILPVSAAVWIALWLTRTEKRWKFRTPRYRPFKCERCGYDLRASDSQCPECGWWIPHPFSEPTPDQIAERLKNVQ